MVDSLAISPLSVRDAIARLDLTNAARVRGVVKESGDGVALVQGLKGVGYEELVEFDSGAYGMAYDLESTTTGVVLLVGAERVGAGDGATGVGRLPSLPVGRAVLGRMIDPLGNPLDEGPPLRDVVHRPLFAAAPEFIERTRVDRPLLTGILAIDAAIPIGRGQRELIIGDRNTGKTSLALDAVAAQHRGDVSCVYVMIGQPLSRALAVRDAFDRQGCLENVVIIVADASSPPGMQYLAPYAGASVAEWFREQGGDALVVYDDLTKHADAYRELALLLDRPPGREAYPGDIFYIHAELLERAAARRRERGGGSVTALPIIETTDNDISAYIPTNLISITDGQIYLDAGRSARNQRPAIDIGRSVSRIGSVAQPPAMRAASRNLRIVVSRFEALESLTRVGLDVDPSTQRTLRRGRIVRELLRQLPFAQRSVAEQVIALTAVSEGWMDELESDAAAAFVTNVLTEARDHVPQLIETLNKGALPETGWQQSLHPYVSTVVSKVAHEK